MSQTVIIQQTENKLIVTETETQLIIQEQPSILVISEQGTQGPQGNPGPNQVTSSTTTNLTGILEGNGSIIGVATPDLDYATPTLTIVNAIIFG